MDISIKHRTYSFLQVPAKHWQGARLFAADLDRSGDCVRTDYGEPQRFAGGSFSYPDAYEYVCEPVMTREEISNLSKAHKGLVPAEALPQEFVEQCQQQLVDLNDFGFTDTIGGLKVQGNCCALVVFEE